MKTLSQGKVWLLMAVLLAGLRPSFCAAEVVAVSNQLAVISISARGTNLVLSASVPAGMEEVAVQTRPTFDVPWEETGRWSVPTNGGEMCFVFPQSADVARFFRLRAKPILQTAPPVSAELEFVATASLSTRLSNGMALFHFKGAVDGSDKILISHQGALWDHVNWDWPPEAVAINDTRWNPAEKNYLSTVGPEKFLPETFSLDAVELEVIEGRDVVALERTKQGLMVYLDDTPAGPGEYEFTIKFHPAGPRLAGARPSSAAHLKVAAQVDGSECIKITAREALLEHKTFALPLNLSVNGIPWDATQESVLRNEGASRFLPDGVDFSTARIVSRKGRDLATAWGEKDALWVRFADNPNGSDSYEIEIAFGPE